ncbi:Dynein regulatory complex subunit 6 [Basidiobolus ranarum]|uniref:Dynein regulatory complex subunit 6 n=1 Tax=Basidiobolus ranarum TaxID=34480 RepID=A0ABR2W4Q5_9FUNG
MRKSLNQSCLREIFVWLKKDAITLYQCCLVQNDWLQAGARELYSNPYQYFTPLFEQTQQLRALLLFQTFLESTLKTKENLSSENTKEPLLDYLCLLRSVDLTWFKRLLLIYCPEENQRVLHQDVIRRVFQVYMKYPISVRHLVHTQTFQLEELFQNPLALSSLSRLEICWRFLETQTANEFLQLVSLNCQQLTSLNINFNRSISFELQGVKEILKKQTHGTLKTFRLRKIQLRPKHLDEIMDGLLSGPKDTLLTLGLEQCTLFPGSSLEKVGKLPNLRTLEFGFCYGLCDSHLTHLAESCSNLRNLNLSHTSITITSVRVIIERLGSRLKRLDVSYPYRVDHSLDSCIPLLSQNAKNLVQFKMKGIRYGYPAIEELIESCANLRSLSLGTPYRQEANLADRLLTRIICKCSQLRELDLGNTKITTNGLNALSKTNLKLGEILCVGLNSITANQMYPELNIESNPFWEEEEEEEEDEHSEQAFLLPSNFFTKSGSF